MIVKPCNFPAPARNQLLEVCLSRKLCTKEEGMLVSSPALLLALAASASAFSPPLHLSSLRSSPAHHGEARTPSPQGLSYIPALQMGGQVRAVNLAASAL